MIVYDGAGLYSAPRAWWMLKVMGHDEVAILDGGFPKWKREHRPVEDLVPQPTPRHFTPRANYALVRDLQQMLANLKSHREQVIDFRSANRFAGNEPEPRHGVRPGHIPESANLPYTELTTPEGTLKAVSELQQVFRDRGIDLDRPSVTTCGSGITAAIGLVALSVAGARSASLYDGSWSEWGASPDTPVDVS